MDVCSACNKPAYAITQSEAAEYAERAASAAATSSSGGSPQPSSALVQAAKLLQIRALLVTGSDNQAREAMEAAKAGAAASPSAALLGCSLAVQHVLCDSARQATAEQLEKELTSSQPAVVLDAWAMTALAHHELSQVRKSAIVAYKVGQGKACCYKKLSQTATVLRHHKH